MAQSLHPSDGYLTRLPCPASRLQRESHASSAVLLNTQTCPAPLSHHLPQDASKNPKRTQQGRLVTEVAASQDWEQPGDEWGDEPAAPQEFPFPSLWLREDRGEKGLLRKTKQKSWQSQGF